MRVQIFTKKELSYCFARKDYGPHLAVRFCGKEAVIKALSSIGITGISYSIIEIINDHRGVPAVNIKKQQKKTIIRISVSHTKATAMAFAVAVSRDIYER